MYLLDGATDAWTVISHDDKQVLCDKTKPAILFNNFYMSKPLPISAYFVLALDYQHSSFFEDPIGFPAGCAIEVQHCLVVFALGRVT